MGNAVFAADKAKDGIAENRMLEPLYRLKPVRRNVHIRVLGELHTLLKAVVLSTWDDRRTGGWRRPIQILWWRKCIYTPWRGCKGALLCVGSSSAERNSGVRSLHSDRGGRRLLLLVLLTKLVITALVHISWCFRVPVACPHFLEADAERVEAVIWKGARVNAWQQLSFTKQSFLKILRFVYSLMVLVTSASVAHTCVRDALINE